MKVDKNKILGLLVGCAYGDAMGMPSEMMTRSLLRRTFPKGIHDFLPSSDNDFFGRNFRAGEVTDDTVNTLLVCDTIIENGSFDVEEYLKMLIRWTDENPDKSKMQIGPSTSKAIELLKKGKSYHESGKFGTTNGAAMKVAPIGIIEDYNDISSLVKTVEQLCLPTHHTSIAIQGASVIAAIASFALRNEYREDILWALAEKTIREGEQYGTQLPGASLVERLRLLRYDLKKLSDTDIIGRLETVYGTGFETIETIPSVFTVIILSGGDPRKAASIAANLSGDSDTIGAISTAICGAFNPIFSKREIDFLENVNQIYFDTYVEKLFQIANY